MKILQINASARSAGANSTRLADTITARLLANNPGATVELRDLASQPHPVLDEPALGALFTPADQRTPEQAARVALDDSMIAQVQAVDVIVLGVPMYANAAGIVPVVEALLAKGAALGTVLAFMMSVIALSLPEMVILRKVLKVPLLLAFAGIVGCGILLVGFLFNLVL